MRIFSILITIFLSILPIVSWGQLSGFIYKPSSTQLGKSVLDPNGDGYCSLNSSGFSSSDFGNASELKMIAIPNLFQESPNDLLTGAGTGHTDIVSTLDNQSCYLLTKNVGGINYLIVRFRLDGKSSASKGYSILFDTDNNAANNYTSKNTAFEKEVVLETGKKVAIYTHSVAGTVLSKSYDVEAYHQRSLALTTNSNDADYFYDYFVPLSDLGISGNTRMLAVTITSAQSGVTGVLSDFNGINDSQYNGNNAFIVSTILSALPSVSLASLTEGFVFPKLTTVSPSVNASIYNTSSSISGTCQEANGTQILIYKNGIQIGTAVTNNNTWTLNNVSSLTTGNEITAKSLAAGKNISNLSNTVTVLQQSCKVNTPLITNRDNNSTIVSGTFSGNQNNVQIKLYQQTSGYTFLEVPSTLSCIVSNGSWSFNANVNKSTLSSYTLFAVAVDLNSSCASNYSSASLKLSCTIGVKTAAPTIITSEISSTISTPKQVVVKNNASSASRLYLYQNGNLIGSTSSTVASGSTTTFSCINLSEGDVLTARALANVSNYWLSDISNSLIVTSPLVVTNAPTIGGNYIAGSNKTVSGTSNEISGTEITLYANNSLIGQTTVNSFGTWQVTSLSLAPNMVLSAFAKSTNKIISTSSNLVIVSPNPPTPPILNGPIYVESSSITGSTGYGLTTIYIDGTPIGNTSGSNWTLTNFISTELYKGAQVYATNTVEGVESLPSNVITVEGVVSFSITDLNGQPIGKRLKDDPFQVKLIAKKCNNCTDSLHNLFKGNVTLGSNVPLSIGSGVSANFQNGILVTTVALSAADTTAELIAAHIFDPTANGKSKVKLNTPKADLTLNQVICEGSTPQNLKISTNYPSIVKWQKSDDENFTIANDITVTDSILTAQNIGNVSGTKYYRAVLKTYGNNITYSNKVFVKAYKMSGAEGINGGGKYCQGNNVALSIAQNSGSVIKWHKSSTANFSSVEEILDTNTTLQLQNVSSPAYYRAVLKNGTCPEVVSPSTNIDIDIKPIGGKIFGATICQGYNRSMVLENYNGSIQKWEYSTSPDFSNAQVINNTNNSYTVNNLQTTTYFRVHVANGVCPISYSIGGMIIATPASVGGNLTGNSTVCAGDTSAKLNLSGYNGTITKWQSSPYANFAGNVVEYNNPTTSMYVGSTTSPTYYRAVVKNGICPYATSNPILINVNTPSNGGEIIGSTAVCIGSNSATLKVVNYNGTINYWQSSSSSDFSQDLVNIQNTTNTLNLQNLTQTRYYRAVVTNGVCAPAFSATGSIIVSQYSSGGQLPEIVQACSGRNNIDLTLNGSVGSVLRWYKSSTADFSSNVGVVYNNTTTLSLLNTTSSAYYRAEVMSSGCPSAFSTPVFVQVNPTPEPGQVIGATSICSGTSFNLSLQGNSGTIVKWQKSTASDFSSNVIDINSNLATIADSGITTTTYYRAILTNGLCEIPSLAAQIYVYPALGAISVVAGNSNVYGLTATTYSIPAVNNAIAYEWNLPAGMKVVGSTNGNSVNVQIDDIFISGPISVKAIGNCSVSDTRWLLLTNEYVPSSIAMDGSNVVCVTSQNTQNYSVPLVSGATYYRWTLPSGVNLTPGTNPSSNSISLDFTTSFASGYLTVKAEDANGRVLASSTKTIESFTKPTTLTGPNNLCGLTTATFTASIISDATSYGWMFPTGVSIISGANTNSVTVSIAETATVTGYARVQAIGSCGSSTYLSIPISKLPTPGTIVGHEVTCGVTSYSITKQGEITPFIPNTLIYRVLPIEGASNYTWSVPSGVTIVNGQGTQAIEVTVPSGFNVGQVAVSAINATGLCSSSSRSKTISSVLAVISGPSSLCGLTTATYSVPADAGVNFQWTIPTWMTVVGGSTTSSSITVSFSQPICSAGTILVSISSNCGGGNSYSLNVGCTEYTKIQDSQNNAVISSVTPISAIAVSNATGYRFKVTGANSSGVVIDKTTNSFTFSELPSISYGVNFTIEVAYKTALTDFGTYGCATSVMLRNTKIQASQCGINNVALTTPIYCDAVTGATAYKFEISGAGVNSNNTNGTFEIVTPNRYFAFNQVSGVSFGSTYNVRVAVKNPDNLTFSDYSESCQLTIQTTKLQATQCGISGVAANTAIYANAISGATGYRFEVSGPGLNITSNSSGTFVYETTNRFFYFNQVPGMIFGNDYQVRVSAKNPDNVNFGAYGDACVLTLKTTQVQATQINITDVANNVLIYADALNNAAQYRFEVAGPGLSVPVVLSSVNRYFTMSQVPGALFGETYTVRVAAATSTGVFGTYGTGSTIALKTTQIQASQINNTVAYTNTTLIYADALNGAVAYRFEISDLDGNLLQSLEKTVRYFSFTEATNILASGNYNIKVSAKNTNGTVFGRLGSTGMVFVSLPSTGRQAQQDTTSVESNVVNSTNNVSKEEESTTYEGAENSEINQIWEVVVSGNPFNDNFGLNVRSDLNDEISVKILDMNGKILHESSYSADLLNSIKFGEGFSNGTIFVTVTQGTMTKTIKVIKA